MLVQNHRSHAFHPIDGFLQSLPYHIYPFLFPLHKGTSHAIIPVKHNLIAGLYLGLFLFVNIWTVSIHDGDYRVPAFLRPIINGSAHHTDHHLYFTVNYGLSEGCLILLPYLSFVRLVPFSLHALQTRFLFVRFSSSSLTRRVLHAVGPAWRQLPGSHCIPR